MRADSRNLLLFLVIGWTSLAGPIFSMAAPVETPPDHPIVPAFERFYTDPKANAAEAGRLLLSELNCNSCHKAGDKTLETASSTKQAPILDSVGTRVRPDYLRAFLASPQTMKPGTTMPNLLGHLPDDKRRASVEALTHFLASTGRVFGVNPSAKAIASGRRLYQRVGCVACHGPLEGASPRLSTSMPLGDLAAKYTLGALTNFLSDPLKVRPSGRMPAFGFTNAEAGDIAAYLLRDIHETVEPNLDYAYYEGRWDNLPDFSDLKPVKTGKTVGIDLTVAGRTNNFALVFEGYLTIERDGDYTFYLKSDDGSRLLIDDKLAVENDGIHPMKERRGTIRMQKGTHRFVSAYFNGGAGGEYELDYSGPGLARQPITAALSLSKEPPVAGPNPAEPRFAVDETLAAQGRELFAKIGCANCHQMKIDAPIRSSHSASLLKDLRTRRGCLDPAHPANTPNYPLSDRQRETLASAIERIRTPDSPAGVTPRDEVAQTLSRLNCYACHQRDQLGGIETERNAFFQTTQKEMGDEGRIPPPLTGVGAKLTAKYLGHVIAEGSKDRPYMLTRMPRFGPSNATPLAAAFAKLDSVEPVPPVEFHEPMRRVKSDGRYLTGSMALGCIKCHTFKEIESEGIQAIDMTIMTKRLRRDWFQRYLVDPQVFRPGTRMPVAWPMGKSLLPKIQEGDTSRQIEAIWSFLSDGKNAAEPYGLGRDPIPLVPGNEPVIYRNFVQGAGPRAIAVGYPEKANLAFDANDLRVAMIWQGAFIDASKHWSARGAGFQPPLGDNVLNLPEGPGFARLGTGSDPWPTETTKGQGSKFRGYELDPAGRPTFLYDVGAARIADHFEPQTAKEAPSLQRTVTITSPNPPGDLWFRVAVADKIEPASEGWYTVNGEWKVRLESGAEPVLRKSAGKTELLVPINFQGNLGKVVETIVW